MRDRPIRWYGFSAVNRCAPSCLDVEGLCYPSERCYGFCSELSHDVAAMHLHGDFANRQFVRDLFVHEPGRDKRHHLPFAGRQEFIPLLQLSNLRALSTPVLVNSDRRRNGINQILMPYRFGQEVDSAGLHAPHRHGNVAMTGHQNDRHPDIDACQILL